MRKGRTGEETKVNEWTDGPRQIDFETDTAIQCLFQSTVCFNNNKAYQVKIFCFYADIRCLLLLLLLLP